MIKLIGLSVNVNVQCFNYTYFKFVHMQILTLTKKYPLMASLLFDYRKQSTYNIQCGPHKITDTHMVIAVSLIPFSCIIPYLAHFNEGCIKQKDIKEYTDMANHNA